ncbi:MAG: hypothetical protein KME32_21805 [Mojavia pulchra JT2-VF2]|jgi:hypothetical protein|uniref:Uncharacterized protein n=1 Tax=Mojavia pulchra JT2-VF2 TaxID=287848 RepID=A0A951Q0X3_9NOST|nr:hypothetical protein [Mojavia pulchra JT2-VF2]
MKEESPDLKPWECQFYEAIQVIKQEIILESRFVGFTRGCGALERKS